MDFNDRDNLGLNDEETEEGPELDEDAGLEGEADEEVEAHLEDLEPRATPPPPPPAKPRQPERKPARKAPAATRKAKPEKAAHKAAKRAAKKAPRRKARKLAVKRKKGRAAGKRKGGKRRKYRRGPLTTERPWRAARRPDRPSFSPAALRDTAGRGEARHLHTPPGWASPACRRIPPRSRSCRSRW